MTRLYRANRNARLAQTLEVILLLRELNERDLALVAWLIQCQRLALKGNRPGLRELFPYEDTHGTRPR